MIFLKEIQPYGFWKEIGSGISKIGSGIGKIGSGIFKFISSPEVLEPTKLGLQVWLTKEQIDALKKMGYFPREAPSEAGYYQVPAGTPIPYQPAAYQPPVATIPKELYLIGGGIILLLLLMLLSRD